MEQYAAAKTVASESFNAIRIVTVLNAQPYFLSLYDKNIDDARKVRGRYSRYRSFINNVIICQGWGDEKFETGFRTGRSIWRIHELHCLQLLVQ
jgi:hypothetical protein